MIPGDTPPSGTPPDENAFIEEIKQRFEKDIELVTRLDTKANNMITMSAPLLDSAGLNILLFSFYDVFANHLREIYLAQI